MCVAVYVMSISKVMQSTFGGTKIFFSDNNRIGRLRVTRKIILENILFNTKLAGVLCDLINTPPHDGYKFNLYE